MRKTNGQFSKGHVPYNKGIKRGSVSPETEFQKGIHAMQFKGYGVPNVANRVGRRNEVYATTPEQQKARSRGKAYITRKRITYARYLWKKFIGEIPQGCIIYNNNQEDPEDIRIENLEIISRAELLKRNLGRR